MPNVHLPIDPGSLSSLNRSREGILLEAGEGDPEVNKFEQSMSHGDSTPLNTKKRPRYNT